MIEILLMAALGMALGAVVSELHHTCRVARIIERDLSSAEASLEATRERFNRGAQ